MNPIRFRELSISRATIATIFEFLDSRNVAKKSSWPSIAAVLLLNLCNFLEFFFNSMVSRARPRQNYRRLYHSSVEIHRIWYTI